MSSFYLTIPRRGNQCSKGQETLGPGDEYYSALYDDEVNGGFQRQDFCQSCWEIETALGVSTAARSYWKSRVVVKKEESDACQNRDERAMFLLKEALTRNTPEDIAEAFVLALYLARRRLLYLRRQMIQGETLINLYETAATEEMLAVRKVAVSELQIAAVQKSLASKLGALVAQTEVYATSIPVLSSYGYDFR